jgi:hypothetical protein
LGFTVVAHALLIVPTHAKHYIRVFCEVNYRLAGLGVTGKNNGFF